MLVKNSSIKILLFTLSVFFSHMFEKSHNTLAFDAGLKDFVKNTTVGINMAVANVALSTYAVGKVVAMANNRCTRKMVSKMEEQSKQQMSGEEVVRFNKKIDKKIARISASKNMTIEKANELIARLQSCKKT